MRADVPHGADCLELAADGVTHAARADAVDDLEGVGAFHHRAAEEVGDGGARLLDGHAVQVDGAEDARLVRRGLGSAAGSVLVAACSGACASLRRLGRTELVLAAGHRQRADENAVDVRRARRSRARGG